MKFHTLFSSFTFLFLSSSVFTQVFRDAQADKIVHNSRSVWIHEQTNKIRFIDFQPDQKFDSVSNSENLISILDLPANHTFRLKQHFIDRSGISHWRYQQCYQGIPIENAIYILHSRGNDLHSANGDYYCFKGISTIPTLTSTEATNIAENYLPVKTFYRELDLSYRNVPELVILSSHGEYFLVYKIDVFSVDPLFRKFVYVDAHSGKILKTTDRIQEEFHTGTAETKYEGTQQITTEHYADYYRLHGNIRGTAIMTYNMQHGTNYSLALDYTDMDNYWTDTTDQNDAATNAHFATEMTCRYYFDRFGRNSFDGNGRTIASYVNFGTNYVNAFWNGNFVTYGCGDGYNYSALTSIEVVAHEITHAVTQYTAGLEYAYESGALNESFSDIFGVAVDHFANPFTFNYTLGEEFALVGIPFRNMADPKQYGDPDTYKGEYWVTGSTDNGGVHTNSGVQNYWFYLLAEGGQGVNDLGNSYLLEGIGIEKAAAIAYRNLTVYLTPYSDYSDARFFSIQSAIDLFGPCSKEVIAVTNAWYAVGVGEPFSDEIKADFRTSRNYSCEFPATVEFINTSNNAGSFLWDFGDGTFSLDTDPVHTYVSEGSYSVKLFAQGSESCSGIDSIKKSDLITINGENSPIDITCQPTTLYPSEFGIIGFQLNSIHSTTGPSSTEGGYCDLTCEQATHLTAGNAYPVIITTSQQNRENVNIWLDLDNSGDFSDEELVFESMDKLQDHSGNIIIPKPEIYMIPLRMRVASDHASYPVNNACGPLRYGQFEDYTVFIHSNANAPDANFRIQDSIVSTGEPVQLLDRSLNLPDTWLWNIQGGSPNISEEKDPYITYDKEGKYDISLQVSNTFGRDSLYRQKAVEVLPGFSMGGQVGSDSIAGILFDSGGPEEAYSNNEDYGFLIQPTCSRAITLSFMEVSIETSYDYLFVYDGPDESGILLLELTGTTIPGAVTASSGSMYIRFVSDGVVNKKGFKAVWRADIPENIPVHADFSVSDPNPAFFSNVLFIDQSTGDPSFWLWNFGEGVTSGLQHTHHIFNRSGSVDVTLYASNCFQSDSITKEIVIQPMPEMSIVADSLIDTLYQGESSLHTFSVRNLSDTGELLYEVNILDKTSSEIQQKSQMFASEDNHTYKNTLDAAIPGIINQTNKVTQFYKNSMQVITYTSPDLETVMNSFTVQYNLLTGKIPGLYLFDGGTDGYLIEDGGNDMYDGGNYLSTNLYPGILYSNNEVTSHQGFGSSGKYFTSKQPGMFLMAADMDHVSSFSITGNLGADGYGNVDGSVIAVSSGMRTYTGFVKRVSGTGDPSVNHLIIIPDAGYETGQTFSTNSDFDDHSIINLENCKRIYYLVFSTINGSYLPDSVMISLMEAFVQLISPSCEWLTTNKEISSLAPSSSTTVDLFANTENLQSGEYQADIIIRSNDTLNKEVLLPFRLIVKSPNPMLQVVDSVYLSIKSNNTMTYGFIIGNENGGSVLEYSLEILRDSSYNTWLTIIENATGTVEPGTSSISMLQIDATGLEAGSYSGSLVLHSNDPKQSIKQVCVLLQVTEDILPETIENPSNETIRVYPDPATDYLNIIFPCFEYQYVSMNILTSSGKLVGSHQYFSVTTSGLATIPVHDLSPGFYILQLIIDRETISIIRFIKE